jgi:pimeloyl-ACP methyl ester carboxylesterase
MRVRSADGTTIAFDSFGEGSGIIVIGGALSTARNYAPLARRLARAHSVHVLERRGRGSSGPQGSEYDVDREVEDLFAVQAATGATAVFGHSYGGLIALEAARCSTHFSHVVVYEPGVSVGGSIPIRWIPRYRQLLERGDKEAAFASMVRENGFAPRQLRRLPLPCVRVIVRAAVGRRRWHEISPLLASNLAEHEEVARLDDGTVDRYSSIGARVLLLGGQKSPRFVTTELFAALRRTIADSQAEVIDGLDHQAPTEETSAVIAERVRRHLAEAR